MLIPLTCAAAACTAGVGTTRAAFEAAETLCAAAETLTIAALVSVGLIAATDGDAMVNIVVPAIAPAAPTLLKDPDAQRHAQAHDPSALVVPVPDAMLPVTPTAAAAGEVGAA